MYHAVINMPWMFFLQGECGDKDAFELCLSAGVKYYPKKKQKKIFHKPPYGLALKDILLYFFFAGAY